MTEKIRPLNEDIMKAIEGEQAAIAFYEMLLRMTHDRQDAEVIKKILLDEEKHLNMFLNLYTKKTGKKPDLYPPKPPHVNSFIEGVKYSVIDELDAYDFYKDVCFKQNSTQVKMIFLEAAADENEHAGRFNYMYTKCIEEGRIGKRPYMGEAGSMMNHESVSMMDF